MIYINDIYRDSIVIFSSENIMIFLIVSIFRITNLRYADDTTSLANNQEIFQNLVQESARYNMYIDAQKSKIMVVSRQDNISVQVDR